MLGIYLGWIGTLFVWGRRLAVWQIREFNVALLG